MIRGPVEYVPPVEVEVVTKRTAIPLDENEGIYVRNIKTGKVREVAGETYMLNQDEELWEKELPPGVEGLLALEIDPLADRGYYARDGGKGSASKSRDKTHVVNFRVPHNAAVQIYDYKEKMARYTLHVVQKCAHFCWCLLFCNFCSFWKVTLKSPTADAKIMAS